MELALPSACSSETELTNYSDAEQDPNRNSDGYLNGDPDFGLGSLPDLDPKTFLKGAIQRILAAL
jgi:hypothetical protein